MTGAAVGLLVMVLAAAVYSSPARDAQAPVPVKVLHVVDGDTLDVEAHVWPGIVARSRVRLAGVNTPESRGPVTACELKAGREAKAFTAQWLEGRARLLAIAPTGQDKYGRLLVHVRAGDEDLARALVEAGHARPYAGGKRAPWCLP